MERDLLGWDDAAWERMRGAVDEVTDEPAGPDAVRLGVLLSDAQACAVAGQPLVGFLGRPGVRSQPRSNA